MKYSLTAKGHGKDALGQVDMSLTTTVAASTASAWPPILSSPPPNHGARTEQYLACRKVEKELQRKAQHNENNKETV